MANKDGVLSIGIEYKAELNKMIADLEGGLDTISKNNQLSKGMKQQFDNVIAEVRNFKATMEKELATLGSGKVDKTAFKSFKQTVANNFKTVREDIDRLDLAVSTLNSQMEIISKGVDLSKITKEFAGFEDYVNRTNDAVLQLIDTLGQQGISLFSFDNRNILDTKNKIKEIDNIINQLDTDKGAKFELFDEKEAQAELDRLSIQLRSTLELMEHTEKQMSNMDNSTVGFKKMQGDFALLQLKAASLNDTIEMLYEVTEGKGIFIKMDDKSIELYDKYTEDLSDNLDSIVASAKNAKKELSSLLVSQKQPTVKVSNEMNPNSSELATTITIETTSSELWKKLSPILTDLQGTLNSNPVVAPVKLVVAPNAVSSTENGDVGKVSNAYSKKYAKVLSETGEDAVIDLEGVYKKTFTSIMDAGVSYAKETISKIQDIFDKSPISIKYDISQEEINKIQNFVLSNKDGKKVDISNQITKAKQEVEELNVNIEKTSTLLQETKSKGNVKFDGFDKFTQDISKSIGKLEELQNILKALQNIEITLAKASGLSSITEIENQWESLEQRIINATKLDGSFRKNASISKIASEYQKYIDMGGTNSISDISKIKENKDTIDAIISKSKEFQKQDFTNNSIEKLSVDLDGIISKFNELISTVKTATNELYKIIREGNVSDLDKQWSSISNKFKSIADESDKINLSKQKKDVQELMEMYQKYLNAGGMKSPFDLTDNTETLAKLNNVYSQINNRKLDTSSISKEKWEFGTVKESVDNLTGSINTKTDAIKTEANTMELAARAEVKSIGKIIESVNQLIERIKSISDIKVPEINISDILPSDKSNISSGNEPKIPLANDDVQNEVKETISLYEKLATVIKGLADYDNKSYGRKEQALLLNSKSGATSNIVDGTSVGADRKAHVDINSLVSENLTKGFDTWVHSHPSDVAIFSEADLKAAFEMVKKGFSKAMLVSFNQVATLDAGSISEDDQNTILAGYQNARKQLAKQLSKEFRTYGNMESLLKERNGGEEFSYEFIKSLDGVDQKYSNITNELKKSIESYLYSAINQFDKNSQVSSKDFKSKLLDNIFQAVDKLSLQSGFSFSDSEQLKEDYIKPALTNALKTFNTNLSNANWTKYWQDNPQTISVFEEASKKILTDMLTGMGYSADKIFNVQSVSDYIKTPIKDVFQGDAEKTGMDNIASATEEAVQAKKDFATANEGVQSSVDGSKSKLELEAELMESIAKNAREAADAKKEFVDANEKVNNSATKSSNSLDKENTSLLSGYSENAEPSGIKKYQKKGYKAHDTGNHDNEKKVANKSELGKVLKELQTEIISSIDETTSFIKEVTDFYDSADNLVKTQMKIGDKNGSMRTYTTSYSIDKEGNATAWTSHIETQKIEQEAKAVQKLAEEKRKLRQQEKQSTKSSVDKALTDQVSAWKKIQSIREKIAKSNDSQEIANLQQRKKEYQEQYINADKILKTNSELYDKEVQLAKLEEIRLNTNKNIEKYKISPIQSQISSYQNTLSKYTDSSKYTDDFVSRVQGQLNNLKTIDITNEKDVARLKSIETEINTIISDSTRLENKLIKQGSKLSDIISDMKIYRASNTNMSITQEAELTNLINTAQELNKIGKVSASTIEEIKKSFSSIKAQVSETGNEGLKAIDRITQRAKDMNAKFFAQFLSFQDWIRYFREGFNIINDIDKSITELRKVSNATEGELNSALRDATNTAKELGASIKDVVSLQADWARLGYSIPESEELARVTQLYVNVGDNMSTETASENLISTLQGFQLDASEAQDIIDKFNEVANNYAIDTQGIGEALKRSAASFNAANTSLSESIALITTANAVVQDPDSIGTTFKTLSARIRGAETELEQLGQETDDYTKTTSKLRDLVKSLTGFDIMIDEDTFKSVYEILLGIGKEWDKLTDVQQASLGEALAGKRNANVLYSVMQNIDQLEAVYKTAEESAGSAQREQENHQKSIQYSIDSTKASLQALVNDFAKSDFFKGIIDAGGNLIDILDIIVKKGAALPIILGTIGSFSISKNFKNSLD